MSYARWGLEGSQYYIYWSTSNAKRREDEVLAIWRIEYRSYGPGVDFTYQEIKGMLEHDNFSAIRGFIPEDRNFLRPLLQEFISDVDKYYKEQV